MANRFWVGGTGTWDNASTTHWSATSGGAAGASAPTTADIVIFDANSNTGTAAFTVTVSTSAACLDFTTGGAGGALDGVMTLSMSGATLNVAGNLTFPATNFAVTSTFAINFTSTAAQTITTNGVSLTCGVTFNGVGGSWQLQDNLTLTGANITATLTNGTLDLNGKTLSATIWSSSNSNTRVITFGGGKIVASGNNATILSMATTTNFSFTGTPTFQLSYAGATGIRTVNIASSAGDSETLAVNLAILGGADTVSLNGSFKNVDFTGCAGIYTVGSNKIYGDLTLGAGMTLTAAATPITFSKTTGTQTVTPNSVTVNSVTINGVGGTVQLLGNLTCATTRTLTLTNGTLDLNGKTLTTGLFTTATGTKNITFNGGSLVVTDASLAFNNVAPTNFTTTAGTANGVISMTSASAKTFAGGGSTFAAALNQGGAGALSVTGSNTLADLTNSTQPASILFTAATTNTFTSGFSLSGTAGNLITLGSITAASHTLSKASGIVSVNYVTISRSTAQGGAVWDSFLANGNVDGGNNVGWIFTIPSSVFKTSWPDPPPMPRRPVGFEFSAFALIQSQSGQPFIPFDFPTPRRTNPFLDSGPAGVNQPLYVVAGTPFFGSAQDPVPRRPYGVQGWTYSTVLPQVTPAPFFGSLIDLPPRRPRGAVGWIHAGILPITAAAPFFGSAQDAPRRRAGPLPPDQMSAPLYTLVIDDFMISLTWADWPQL